MDYEKRFKDVLNKFAYLLESTDLIKDELREDIEHIFPELKGCTDERIRRVIKKSFEVRREKENVVKYNGVHVEDILAWLERQKEPKVVIPKFRVGDRICFKGDEDNNDTIAEIHDGYYLNPLGNRMDMSYTDANFELEGWSKEDIEMIEWLIRCCKKEHEELCNDRYGHQEIVSDLKRDCRKKWDWLESLKGKVVPQKQWKPSEEQMIQLHKYCIDNKPLNELYEQLKNI